MPAHVHSVDALREAKAAIDWFLREAAGAIAEADAELQRTLGWLEREALPHWERQIKRATQAVAEARSEFYRQQLIANPNTPTALQQRKAWDRAIDALRDAEERKKAVRRWIITWERESALYKGAISGLGESISHDLPGAAAKINRLVELLEQYAALRSEADASAIAFNAGENAGAGADERSPDGPGMHDRAEPNDAEHNTAGADLIDELPDAYALLRGRTPPAGLRVLVPLTDPAMVASTSAHALHPGDSEALARLAMFGPEPGEDLRVTLRSGALVAPSLHMERTAPGRDDDSGWFLGSAGGMMGSDLQSIPVWLLRLKRPDLGPLLALPAGSLVAMGAGRILALLDAENRDQWRQAPEGAGPEDHPGRQ